MLTEIWEIRCTWAYPGIRSGQSNFLMNVTISQGFCAPLPSAVKFIHFFCFCDFWKPSRGSIGQNWVKAHPNYHISSYGKVLAPLCCRNVPHDPPNNSHFWVDFWLIFRSSRNDSECYKMSSKHLTMTFKCRFDVFWGHMRWSFEIILEISWILFIYFILDLQAIDQKNNLKVAKNLDPKFGGFGVQSHSSSGPIGPILKGFLLLYGWRMVQFPCKAKENGTKREEVMEGEQNELYFKMILKLF